jgi:hypothetical protein
MWRSLVEMALWIMQHSAGFKSSILWRRGLDEEFIKLHKNQAKLAKEQKTLKNYQGPSHVTKSLPILDFYGTKMMPTLFLLK